ncbi:hypothetical protein [Anoxybacteroides tepidamans]|uniref:hypothetical protein n=1 Tax=Anoxybacteroides tepidamans TaxID=265948 RepID=UPI0004890157|nr:hypothetical protein [Anoxybacillus tepidamans]
MSSVSEEDKNRNKELLHLTSTLMEGLKSYNEVKDIKVDDQKSITIETKIKGFNKNGHERAKEIEEKVKELIRSKDASAPLSYKVYVKNAEGKVMN